MIVNFDIVSIGTTTSNNSTILIHNNDISLSILPHVILEQRNHVRSAACEVRPFIIDLVKIFFKHGGRSIGVTWSAVDFTGRYDHV
jgi:hypothetical protein